MLWPVGALALGAATVLTACSENLVLDDLKTKAPEFIARWGTQGHGDGEFWFPTGVAVAPNGNVYVVDYLSERVQYFTSTGSY